MHGLCTLRSLDRKLEEVIAYAKRVPSPPNECLEIGISSLIIRTSNQVPAVRDTCQTSSLGAKFIRLL